MNEAQAGKSFAGPGFSFGGAMKLTNRLLACAALVTPGNAVADIGTDHGYLPIYLLTKGICPNVIAADLRKKPLEAAKRNVGQAQISSGISFCLSDGLENVPIEQIQTVICAGMGGDCISGILARAREIWSPKYQLILQPQSAVSDLRRWLAENGFIILREKLARDGAFIYTVLEARYGGGMPESAGYYFLSKALLRGQDPLLPDYYLHVKDNLVKTVSSLQKAKVSIPAEVRDYFGEALQEVIEMGEQYGFCE